MASRPAASSPKRRSKDRSTIAESRAAAVLLPQARKRPMSRVETEGNLVRPLADSLGTVGLELSGLVRWPDAAGDTRLNLRRPLGVQMRSYR